MNWLPIEKQGDGERKLRRADRIFLLGCVLVSALTLAVGFALFPKVNPEASIRFTVDRSASEETARQFLVRQDLGFTGTRHASRFTYDDEAKVFLERTLGMSRANELMAGPVHMWRWGHRWFRPLQKEETSILVATTGEVVGFTHQLPEDAPGANLLPAAARELAEAFLTGALGQSLKGLEYVEGTTEKRPARTDHVFTWKRTGLDLGEGDYRLQVTIQGDRPGGYKEFVHVPERWSRSYAELRSKNMSASVVASAFFILTFLAVLIVLFVRLRLRDIRWRTASVFGAIGAVLQFCTGLNDLPKAMYAYETTASFSGYLIHAVFLDILFALLLGLSIFILTAAGESLYRHAYPDKVSLTRFFTRSGLRTRRFLLSSVLGLCLTCVFFCYQEVFYSVAGKLGAWAPMDVPYDDMLNTAVPWVFILLMGFMPSVTEEFLSRMFSIPFLQKYTRSTALAVILPAVIWGFGHSGYPNQPFFIRGLEVGLAGILIGMIMLRVNILATLVWHFTIDALLTGYLLFRSGNAYYIVSAAVAGGLMLLPVGYALFSYWRRGEFSDPQPLLNRAEAGPPAETLPAPAVAAEAESIELPAELPPTWSARRRVSVFAAGAASLLLLFLPGGGVDDSLHLSVSRAAAREKGLAWLRGMGEDPDSFRVSLVLQTAGGDSTAKYILEQAGVERLRREYERFQPQATWGLRLYRPLTTREMKLRIEGAEGRVISYTRHLAEKDSLASPGQEAAQQLAHRFLGDQGIDLSILELKEASEAKRPRRSDYTFIWESREQDPDNVGRAHHRIRVVVQGNQIGAFQQSLKLPEEWVRARNQKTAVWSLRLILMIMAGGALLGLLLWMVLQCHRQGRIPWKRISLWSLPFAPLYLLGSLNTLPLMVPRYDTSVPWSGFLIMMVVGIFLGVLVSYGMVVVSLALVSSAWPEAWSLRGGPWRRRHLPDAIVGSISALAVMVSLRHLSAVCLHLWPGLMVPPSPPSLTSGGTIQPWFGLVHGVFRSYPVALAGTAGILGLLRLRQGRSWWILLLLAGVIALVPLEAKTGPEFLLGFSLVALKVAVLLLLARWFVSDNLLAVPLLVYAVLAVQGVTPFLGIGGSELVRQGVVAAVVLALPLVWLVLSGRKGLGARRG